MEWKETMEHSRERLALLTGGFVSKFHDCNPCCMTQPPFRFLFSCARCQMKMMEKKMMILLRRKLKKISSEDIHEIERKVHDAAEAAGDSRRRQAPPAQSPDLGLPRPRPPRKRSGAPLYAVPPPSDLRGSLSVLALPLFPPPLRAPQPSSPTGRSAPAQWSKRSADCSGRHVIASVGAGVQQAVRPVPWPGVMER
ncbi:hypothetical protein H920_18554 [Fukomys damarensis]|uniref:Uncharacterized protein n=1 Tax=Fukomys damarensis TaxID=885580 RepID=A0A091CQR3_FUKDA|nr:hypothetical protein H920_18554 [Fukomys damarensis]